MSGAILRRRDQTNRPLRVDHYSAAVNTMPRLTDESVCNPDKALTKQTV